MDHAGALAIRGAQAVGAGIASANHYYALAACSDAKPKPAVNEMIESPLQNTVISSFEIYPPKPIPRADGRLTPVYCAESAD